MSKQATILALLLLNSTSLPTISQATENGSNRSYDKQPGYSVDSDGKIELDEPILLIDHEESNEYFTYVEEVTDDDEEEADDEENEDTEDESEVLLAEVNVLEEQVESVGYQVVPLLTEKQFIQMIGQKARRVAYKNELYASVMIAQASLESGFGRSLLASKPYYNLFGIKGSYAGASVSMLTQEEDNKRLIQINSHFRRYDSFDESFEDYAELITNGIDSNSSIYSGVTKNYAETYQEATAQLVGVYATDSRYDQKLNAIIDAYDLTRFDKMTTETIEHPVLANETLVEIAEHYEVPVSAIYFENEVVDQDTTVASGDRLLIEAPAKFELPLNGNFQVTSPFGERGDEHHDGIDLAAPLNTPVYAAQTGQVVATGYDHSAGNYVIIKHSFDLFTSYFHLNEITVEVSELIELGTEIGLVGSTGHSSGPHLHFGISDDLWDGYYDPENFLDFHEE